VLDLRPETTLSTILAWGAARRVESFDFALVFYPELRGRFGRFLEESDGTTFREMVQWYVAWLAPAGKNRG
jgi:hypothetical protein